MIINDEMMWDLPDDEDIIEIIEYTSSALEQKMKEKKVDINNPILLVMTLLLATFIEGDIIIDSYGKLSDIEIRKAFDEVFNKHREQISENYIDRYLAMEYRNQLN